MVHFRRIGSQVSPEQANARISSRKSSKNRRKIGRKSSKIGRKSTKNRPKFDLGQLWAFKAVSGTRRDALRTGSGRPKAALGPILGRPGRAKSGRRRSKSVPGRVPNLSGTAPKRRSNAFGASSAVERACGTIFRRFRLVARKLRCASCISFYSVLLCSNEVSNERAREAKNLENRRVSASKIDVGTVRATENRCQTGQLERQNAKVARC